MIEEYVQSLLNRAAASPIVSASNIVLDKRINRSGLIRGDLYFLDGLRLHFRELVDAQTAVVRLMYSYHYQDSGDNLIFRYDDTPHHAGLANSPHHKHIEKEDMEFEAAPPAFAQVLTEIEHRYPLDE